jgi:predicted ATPase
VPDTIHAVLAARIDRLPPAEKRLLQAAAVIGKDIALPLLQALAGRHEEELHQGLRYLQAAEFFYETRLVPEPTYTFKHVLTQEVAYQSLLHSMRQAYHHQIAQLVEERFPEIAATQPEWLAHHYTAAGLMARAIPYWRRAGQRAIERSAYVEAISHLTHGLEVLKALPETPERTLQELDWQMALGFSLVATKDYAVVEVEQAFARARELCQQVWATPRLFPLQGRVRALFLMRWLSDSKTRRSFWGPTVALELPCSIWESWYLLMNTWNRVWPSMTLSSTAPMPSSMGRTPD